MVTILKALGDENRLRIINLLSQKELCVCEIETLLDMSQSNVSRHLTKLKNAGVINSKKDAQWIHYVMNPEFVINNKSLYSYLLENFKANDVFLNDLTRLNKYDENEFNCQFIKNDKNNVLSIIKMGE